MGFTNILLCQPTKNHEDLQREKYVGVTIISVNCHYIVIDHMVKRKVEEDLYHRKTARSDPDCLVGCSSQWRESLVLKLILSWKLACTERSNRK